MPTIPLLKPSTELAMPQVPALDQVKRPNIDVRGVLAAMDDLGKASMRRPVDAAPFVEAAGAKGKAMGSTLESVGSALTDVSSVLGALARKRTEEQNRVGIIKAQSAMQAGTQEVQDHFDKNPDKPESFVHHALAVGGKVLKGLGHILGLDHWGHHSVAHESRTWHRELLAGAQAASDKQLFRNSADAQVAQFNGLMDRGKVEEGGAMLPSIRESGVVNEKDLDQMGQRLVEVGGQQEVAKVYAAMRDDPKFTLEKGLGMVDGFKYVPKEMRQQVKGELTNDYAELGEERQVAALVAKDPSAALAALADRNQFRRLKPATRVALVKGAEGERERMGALAYEQSKAFVNALDGDQLKAMTPRKLEEAMAGGKDAALWGQAELFHKKLARHYLALKQGTEQLNDPEARLALEAAIDHHVPDLNGPVEAAHLRMSIEHGFEGADRDQLLKRLDGREKARVPATTADAQELIYHLAYQDNAIGKVRVPVTDIEGLPQQGDPDELDFTGREYASKLMPSWHPGQQTSAGKPVTLTRVDETAKRNADYQATILSRLLTEKNAKEPFKKAEDAVRFVKDEARARGWQVAEDRGASATADRSPTAAAVAEPDPNKIDGLQRQDLIPATMVAPSPDDRAGTIEAKTGKGIPAMTDQHAGGSVHGSSDLPKRVDTNADGDVRDSLPLNLGSTGKSVQALAAPTQPVGGWMLVHNVGVEDSLSSPGNVDLKAVADSAGFHYTQRNDPKIAEFEKGVGALKSWDIYVYSGHGTPRGNVVAYGAPPTGSKYEASLFNDYTIVPPADLPPLMKMGDPKHDLYPGTMPLMCFFDACYVDPVAFPKTFIDAGTQVVIHPRGRGESIAPIAKSATEAYFNALLVKGATFKEALKEANDIIDVYNQTKLGKVKPMTPYFTTYGAGVTEDSKFKDLKRP